MGRTALGSGRVLFPDALGRWICRAQQWLRPLCCELRSELASQALLAGLSSVASPRVPALGCSRRSSWRSTAWRSRMYTQGSRIWFQEARRTARNSGRCRELGLQPPMASTTSTCRDSSSVTGPARARGGGGRDPSSGEGREKAFSRRAACRKERSTQDRREKNKRRRGGSGLGVKQWARLGGVCASGSGELERPPGGGGAGRRGSGKAKAFQAQECAGAGRGPRCAWPEQGAATGSVRKARRAAARLPAGGSSRCRIPP